MGTATWHLLTYNHRKQKVNCKFFSSLINFFRLTPDLRFSAIWKLCKLWLVVDFRWRLRCHQTGVKNYTFMHSKKNFNSTFFVLFLFISIQAIVLRYSHKIIFSSSRISFSIFSYFLTWHSHICIARILTENFCLNNEKE